MVVTARRMPVPEPMAPMKSAATVSAPMHMPPKAAAVGMYRLSSLASDESRWPFITICWSRSCLATSLADEPDTSIQVLEKRAHATSTKAKYRTARSGSSSTSERELGVVREALVQQLRDKVDVGDEGRLQDDGHVGRVEELDRVGGLHAALRAVLDGQVDAEALEVDDHQKDEHRRHDVGHVGQVLPVEGLLERLELVLAREHQVEERDQRALEFGAAASVDGRRREGLPHDGLADVGRDEERDARAQPVSLLQQLVQDDDDDAGHEELHDDEDRVARAQLAHIAVHAGDDVGHRLADGDQDAEKLLRAVEEGAVLLQTLVDVDDLGAREELHHQAGGDDGRDA
eukprot:scaffold5311_cov120-Isochrysis_galbana.AAC.13